MRAPRRGRGAARFTATITWARCWCAQQRFRASSTSRASRRAARRAPRQAIAAARRGGHAALLQLRALERVAPRGAERRTSWRLAPLRANGSTQTRAAFLDGYTAAMGVARRRGARDPYLLALFELEKAFYELRYELNNRPDWVPMPLQASWLVDPHDASRQGDSHGQLRCPARAPARLFPAPDRRASCRACCFAALVVHRRLAAGQGGALHGDPRPARHQLPCARPKRAGIDNFLRQGGMRRATRPPSSALLAYWLVILASLVIALQRASA